MLTHESKTQRERLLAVALGRQPDSREGQAGLRGESEWFIVARKPGHAGGAKEPQFQGQCFTE